MCISGAKYLLAEDASLYGGNVEHYHVRLLQDDVDLHKHGLIHCAMIST